MAVIRGVRTSLRRVSPNDLDLLAGWLADPDVYAFWGGKPLDRQIITRQFVNGPEHGAWVFIVEHDEQPIGWIQYWHLNDDPTQDSGGIDMVLIPSARGQGLGPDAARALVNYLIRERGWRRVTVDPSLDNPPAIRAWARAGFVADHEAPDHPDGPALIMAIDDHAWEPGAHLDGAGTAYRVTIRGVRTILRPLCLADLDLMEGWFADPGMYAFWGGRPLDRDALIEEFIRAPEGGVWVFIVEHDGQPIGWIQYWHLDNDPTENSGGIDIVLIPSARGQGLGPDAVRALADYLIRERGWRRVIVNADRGNAAANRAWTRAGFVADHERHDISTEPTVVMAIDAETWTRDGVRESAEMESSPDS